MTFQTMQIAFANYIRNPHSQCIPQGINAERLAVVSELFFNNIEGFISSCFPVLKSLHTENAWLALLRDFFSIHHCKTPYFAEIAQEFLDYLENERQSQTDYAFMLELAHYEWVEMALSIDKAVLITNPLPVDNLLTRQLTVSPLAWALVYQYPVHKISPTFIPQTPPAQPSFLIVHRDINDDVHFFEITPLTYRLLNLIQDNDSLLAKTCLQQLALETGQLDVELLCHYALPVLMDLVQRHIICVV